LEVSLQKRMHWRKKIDKLKEGLEKVPKTRII
jgi:hypothetical protein